MSEVINNNCLWWSGLGIVVFLATFGLAGCLSIIICLTGFLLGFIGLWLFYGHQKTELWLKEQRSINLSPTCIGLQRVVEAVQRERPSLKADSRMTGSNVIDEVLSEVMEYMYRDYVYSWFKKIGEDDAQFKYDILSMLRRVVIAFSDRSKQVDLVPYFTKQLVDEFASHIRLYRRALVRVKEHRIDESKPPADLVSTFFDLEIEMEKNKMCRDLVCTDDESERQYLHDLSDVLLFLVLPPEDFHNKPFRYILREVLVNGVFLPTMDLISDPDYINQTMSWMLKDTYFSNEPFLVVMRYSDSLDEMHAVKEKVDYDIVRQRSRDTGGNDDTLIKQQLRSLVYVRTICETRMQELQDGTDSIDGAMYFSLGWDLAKLMAPGQKLYSLPFDVVLENNVALSYFIEFMSNIGMEGYVFLYLTIEGYKVSAEQQMSAALLAESGAGNLDLEMLKNAAAQIYTQYLSEKASPRLIMDDQVLARAWYKIQNEEQADTIFDEVQSNVWNLMQEEQFFPSFKKSQLYIKLLAELDLLKDSTTSKTEEALLEEEILAASVSKGSSLQGSVEDLHSSCDSLSSVGIGPVPRSSSSSSLSIPQFTLRAEITNTSVCREFGKAYAVYFITVTRVEANGSERTWHVYRRYSDFDDLHMTIQDKYSSLVGLALPSKKAFNNLREDVLERRKIGLNAYLQTLIKSSHLPTHNGLLDLVYQFLETMVYEREKSPFARKLKKMDTFVNPLKKSVKNVGNIVKSMPDNIIDGIINTPSYMLDGVYKMLNVKATSQSLAADLYSAKVGDSLENEDEDSIPFRLLLLLMDEVFDLKARNGWYVRKVETIVRQIVKTVMGDSINRKIVDHVETMTSAEQIAEYIKTFRDIYWPEGVLAEPMPTRDLNTKMRTRIVCKTKLLGTMSDELRHVIGSETTRQGCMRLFNMFQHQTLNKRLLYVFLEGWLQTIFPDNKFNEVFRKLHSRSPRVPKDVESSSGSDLKVPSGKVKR